MNAIDWTLTTLSGTQLAHATIMVPASGRAHPDKRYANRSERRKAGYIRGYSPVGGWIVRKDID